MSHNILMGFMGVTPVDKVHRTTTGSVFFFERKHGRTRMNALIYVLILV